MKKICIATMLTAALLFLGCSAPVADSELVSPFNEVAKILSSDVEKLDANLSYKQIITELGATQDIGSGVHMAVYLVDSRYNLLISFADLSDVCELSGIKLLETLVSAADITGRVTHISQAKDGIVMLVEADEPKTGQYDKASVRVGKETSIIKDNTGDVLSYSDIKTEDMVQIVFEGPVAESYPIQASALSVFIIG